MSFRIPKGYLEKSTIEILCEKCTFEFIDQYKKKTSFVFFEEDQDSYSFPIALWEDIFESKPETPKSEKRNFHTTLKLGKRGRIDQEDIFSRAIKFLEKGYVMINLPTNSGKTSISVYLSCHLKLKTLIVCSLTKVLEQWKEAFLLNSNAKVTLLESSKTDFSDSDIVICTPHIFSTLSDKLKNFPLVICDEIHSHTRKILKTLLKYRPKYLVGLTATLKRKDGLHKAFPLYFSKNIISEKETKEGSVVYKIETGYVPTVKYRKRAGKKEIDYVSMISDIGNSGERNQIIVDHLFSFLSEGKVG